MTLVVDAPAAYDHERRYILGVVLSDWLGVDWRLRVHDAPEVRVTCDGDGRRVVWPDVLFATPPSRWLTAASLPALPVAHGTVDAARGALTAGERLPILYGRPEATTSLLTCEGDEVRLGVDVLGSAFFMLTRYEERAAPAGDAYGRFPAAASAAGRSGFLGLPVVDAYVELLWHAVKTTWPRLERRARTYTVRVTHDVDDPLALRGRGPAGIARQFAADVVSRRDPALGWQRARALARSRRHDHRLDPHNTFDFLMDASERHGHRSAFYFISNATPSARNGTYVIGDPWIGELMAHIDGRGHEVGYHASFESWNDPARTREEFSRLRAVAGRWGVEQQEWGGRQHYLRWANPVTWSNWDDAGLSYDSTVAFADAVGFRTGTSHPFKVFDLERRCALRLVEQPFQVMDSTLFSYMSLSPAAAHSAVVDVAVGARRFGGTLGILWHNSELKTARQKRWYTEMLEAVSGLAS
jgi:hypothetical protein